MDESKNILKFLHENFNAPGRDEGINELAHYFRYETFKKKEIIFRNGDVNTRHYFIQNGLLRLYLIDSNGKEFNLLFAKENQVLGDLATPEPTNFNLEAIEDSKAYSIDNKNFLKLTEHLDAKIKLDGDNYLRRSYIFLQKRLVAILSGSAEENYLEFRKKNPDLIQRLPQYHIASYLGVSAEFLSKIIAKTTKSN